MTLPTTLIINQSKSWVERVVIGCNFCPFAGKAFVENKIRFTTVESEELETQLEKVLLELQRLDEEAELETTLIIFPNQHSDFMPYLDFVSLAEGLVAAHEYEGVYQIASFHPSYVFAGSDESDPSNYTNRSPYPMIHLLREESVSKAVELHPDVDGIPETNIAFTKEKGLAYMKALAELSVSN